MSLGPSFPREVGEALEAVWCGGAARRKGRLGELPADQVFGDTMCECVCTHACAELHAGWHLTRSSKLRASWSVEWAWEGKASRSFPKGRRME